MVTFSNMIVFFIMIGAACTSFSVSHEFYDENDINKNNLLPPAAADRKAEEHNVLASQWLSTQTKVIQINPPLNPKHKMLSKKYKPDWKDLDSRPLPEWYDRAKIGIFVHWGVYSVPGVGSEWFWAQWKNGNSEVVNYMKKNYRPGFTYQEFASQFTAEFFNPVDWANLFASSGAKYVVLTSKHHDGFTLFPSKQSFSWNSVDVGPHRDLVGDLAKAVRARNLEFGLYHSLYEWYNPLYIKDKKANYTTQIYSKGKLWPDFKQIVNDYEPSVIWSDGDWEASPDYWDSTNLLTWLYNDSPVKDKVVVNDRWGKGTGCKHGGFYNCEDRYNPGVLQKHKWENAFTIDRQSWGYRRNINITSILNITQLIKEIVMTVSCGGNALINIGPTKEGTIAPIFQERLLELGRWLKTNGEAIFNSSPWLHQNDSLSGDVWYTCTRVTYNRLDPIAKPQPGDELRAIYAFFFTWPKTNVLILKDIALYLHKGNHTIQLLELHEFLKWSINNGSAIITLPNKAKVQGTNGWVLKLTRT